MTRRQPPQPRSEMLLHQIPPSDRQSFEAYYQERLRAALSAAEAAAAGSAEAAADRDAVEASVLAALVREAEGVDDPDGMGFVPHPDPVVHGYELQPPLADPRSLRRGPRRVAALGRVRVGAAATVVLVATVGLTWHSMRQSSAPGHATVA